MPTYQYACTECDHRFEAVQSFSDSALTECPQCSGKLRKLYGAVGVVFKGSGFYRTDSRSASSAAPKSDAPKSESKSASTSSTSTSSSSSSSSSAPAAAAS
ncbi:FmdB family zinc ribbon protein [Actinosynnema sp. NPDC023658]|uniref:FmdB family zinc ribbon protein n=1 Tax=Actinosynnema sp. NPDC023658 TaxID=3155465 RepID=UPI0033C2D96A